MKEHHWYVFKQERQKKTILFINNYLPIEPERPNLTFGGLKGKLSTSLKGALKREKS